MSGLRLTRAGFLASGMSAAAVLACRWPTSIGYVADGPMQTRPIPSSRESFCRPSDARCWLVILKEGAPLAAVLRTLFAGGGSVIGSSPMYGRSKGVVGDLLADEASRGKTFLATKVWTRGRAKGSRLELGR